MCCVPELEETEMPSKFAGPARGHSLSVTCAGKKRNFLFLAWALSHANLEWGRDFPPPPISPPPKSQDTTNKPVSLYSVPPACAICFSQVQEPNASKTPSWRHCSAGCSIKGSLGLSRHLPSKSITTAARMVSRLTIYRSQTVCSFLPACYYPRLRIGPCCPT